MRILKELDELVQAEVVNTDTADRISNYYKLKANNSGNRLFIVFGILGSLLIGLGIVLIIAHNWDDLSKNIKVAFAYLPLVIAQMLCGYSLLKKTENVAWREASSAFLFFAVGASISLVSQIYNIQGDLADFLMTWMMLCLPVVYLMRSSMASLLYISGISYYCGVHNGFFWGHTPFSLHHYWWMLLLILPHYYALVRKRPDSNFTVFHNWIIPISLSLCLLSITKYYDELMYIAYLSLFGLFYLIGTSQTFTNMKRNVSSYLVIGSLGTTQILLSLSFNYLWKNLATRVDGWMHWQQSPEFIAAAAFTLLATVFLILRYRKGLNDFHPMTIIFLLFILIFAMGIYAPFFALAAINILILATGIFTIRSGIREDHLGILNYGLLTITALIVCRFFDSNMSFVVRGVLFMIVGAGFFATNYLMLKRRKQTA